MANFALIMTVLLASSVLCSVAFRALFALAINADCRARGMASTAYTVLSVFFPVITGIVYAIKRNKNVSAQSLVKKSIVFFVIAAIFFAGSTATFAASRAVAKKVNSEISEPLEISDEEAQKIADKALEEFAKNNGDTGSITEGLRYYDRDGKAYDSPDKVPFYDRDGNVYHYITDEQVRIFFENEKTGEKLESEKCFVDGDGYFVYDKNGELTFDSDFLTATDSDGNKYSPAALVIWNSDGKMISAIE